MKSLLTTCAFVCLSMSAPSFGRPLAWHAGDELVYKIEIQPFNTNGTVTTQVMSYSSDGFYLRQEVDLGFKKQLIESLVDINGQIKKLSIDGVPQKVTTAPVAKIIKKEPVQVDVVAGSFSCTHTVSADSQGQTSETWSNPTLIPITGLIKSIAPSSGGLVTTLELQGFAHGP